MSDDAIQRFRDAMRSNAKDALHNLAISLRDEGMSQSDLYSLFQKFQIETSADDPRYDDIVDTMDIIHGGPWAKGQGLFPE
jgi:hypothetical protein